jgi:hypothetical protein
MKCFVVLTGIMWTCTAGGVEEGPPDPWHIAGAEQFTEQLQTQGPVERTVVLFANGTRFKIPLYNSVPISTLRGADGSAFLLARGTACVECDERFGLRFFELDGTELKGVNSRHTHPGRQYDYMDPTSLQQTTRTFYGRCLAEQNDVVVWFIEYLGEDLKWHHSNSVARVARGGETLVELKPTDGSLASVLAAVTSGGCHELVGIDGTTEP